MKGSFKYYLYKDEYRLLNEKNYECLNGMATEVPRLFAFTYPEILEYDDKDRRHRLQGNDVEKINHGIFGGQYFFDRMLIEHENDILVDIRK